MEKNIVLAFFDISIFVKFLKKNIFNFWLTNPFDSFLAIEVKQGSSFLKFDYQVNFNRFGMVRVSDFVNDSVSFAG